MINWNQDPLTAGIQLLIILAGVLVATLLMGIVLGRFLQRFLDQDESLTDGGLINGGYWIGISERLLIYIFVLIGEPAGIGFLAAAKSIFRIGEVKEAGQRRLAEYILIGTLMSFASATIVGLVTRHVLLWF